jgi:hypothetical protein
MLAVNPIDIEALSGMRGLSERNLLAIKTFTCEFMNAPITQQTVVQLPWVNPSPAQIGKTSSPRSFHRNSKAASPASRKSKPNSPATSQRVAKLDCQMNLKSRNLNFASINPPKMSMRGLTLFQN